MADEFNKAEGSPPLSISELLDDHDGNAGHGLNMLDLIGTDGAIHRSPSANSIRDLLGSDLDIPSLFGGKDAGIANNARDSSYGIDPLTGHVKQFPNARLDIWTKADQEIADRGYSYGLDPLTGKVTQQPNMRTDLYTADMARRDAIMRARGYYFGIDPRTGDVKRFPYSTNTYSLRAELQ